MSELFAIIEAPSVLGLRDTGVDQLPEALLAAGLAARLPSRRAGRVAPLPYDEHRDPASGMLNVATIPTYSTALADTVGAALQRGEVPLVLGGDCSILLGNLLALRRRGRFGLFFVDGHADFYQPEANINGEAASSELALATGRGPAELSMIEGFDRLVCDEHVVVFGFRDEAEQQAYGSQPLPRRMRAFDLAAVRRWGAATAARRALDHLGAQDIGGVWLHLDADVLSDDIMPAVDYRQNDGFSWEELITVMRIVHGSGWLVGLDVTIYNPRLDPGLRSGAALVSAIVRGLQPAYD